MLQQPGHNRMRYRNFLAESGFKAQSQRSELSSDNLYRTFSTSSPLAVVGLWLFFADGLKVVVRQNAHLS